MGAIVPSAVPKQSMPTEGQQKVNKITDMFFIQSPFYDFSLGTVYIKI